MDDKILALLGDRSAQERITERGVLYMDDIKLALLGGKEAAKRLADAGVKLRNFLN